MECQVRSGKGRAVVIYGHDIDVGVESELGQLTGKDGM